VSGRFMRIAFFMFLSVNDSITRLLKVLIIIIPLDWLVQSKPPI
jgi:hypothetical protein